MTRRILVTGSGGFIGRHVVDALRRRSGLQVICSVRPGSSPPDEESDAVWIDVRSGWPPTLHDIDSVVHLAWWGLKDFDAPIHLEQVEAHARFLTGALEAGVTRLFVAGTCLEYGMVEGELDEGLAPCPSTTYGVAKARLAGRLLPVIEAHGASMVWGRIFYPYGPDASRRTLWTIVHEAVRAGSPTIRMSPGDQRRDFLPVALVGELIAALAASDRWESGPVNICSGVPTTVEQLVAGWLADLGADVRMELGALPYPTYEPHSFWGSRRRLDALLSP